MTATAQSEWGDAARKVMPGGTIGGVDLDVVMTRGVGGHLIAEDGRRYLDFLLGSGPMLLGHAHPEVTAAVTAAVADGTTFYTNTPANIRLAQAIVDAVPCAEHVRYTSSGSEATFFALRAARAWRGRDKVLKFEGGYHGNSDYAVMSVSTRRPGNFPNAVRDSAGVPAVLADEVLIAPFNDIAAARQIIEAHANELAAVIIEPFQRILPPAPGFLEALREVTAKHDIVLIFDEIVTGFRFAYGGAQELYGVTPDLCALGKVVGGGFPLAAVAGRADVLSVFTKDVPGERHAHHSGTLNGNPIGSTAGLATLDVLKRPGQYEALFAKGQRLMDGLTRLVRDHRIPAQVIGAPPVFDIVFATGSIKDYRGLLTEDTAALRRFNVACAEHGLIKGDHKIYVSLAHTDADIDEALTIFDRVLQAMA